MIEASTIKNFADQFKVTLISHIVNVFSRVYPKLHKYLNGTLILTCVLLLFSALPAIFALNLN